VFDLALLPLGLTGVAVNADIVYSLLFFLHFLNLIGISKIFLLLFGFSQNSQVNKSMLNRSLDEDSDLEVDEELIKEITEEKRARDEERARLRAAKKRE
jgi:hypothetical protein